jgi:hypothetical protein
MIPRTSEPLESPTTSGTAVPGRTPSMTTGGLLGTGLLALTAVLGVLMVVWLLANLATGQLNVGGFVFGLLFLAIIALPIGGAGWYLRQRGAQEAAEAALFSARRAVLDQDRVVRRELARDLQQRIEALAQLLPGLPEPAARPVEATVRRLRDVVADVSRPAYDATTWLEQTAGTLGPEQLESIRRYDDLVLADARRLEQVERELAQSPEAAARLAESAELLATHVREREALLGRGRPAATMAPQELLAAGLAPRRALASPLDLRLDDAVTYASADFLVRAIATYFAGGRTWRAYQLFDGRRERWLEVRAGGADLAWYDLHPPAALHESGDAATIEGDDVVPGEVFQLAESGAATVSLESAAGKQDGVYVEYRRYTGSAGARLLVEQWPDGRRLLHGSTLAREDLQVWSRTAASAQDTAAP